MRMENEGNNEYFALETGEGASKKSKSIYKKSTNDNHRHGMTTGLSMNSN